ncbi:MAG: molybdopterin-dependent oxidoreductase, partial [Anaerolineaceae bacterium]|nr:molybdopterin-dependent oxidoreductase [Anaerolineaceae bacterium]
ELSPNGGCRLCLVEVEGYRGLQPSCTLPIQDNMRITTDNPRIRSARTFVLSMLFSERNHFCPFCQVSGGDCELQNAAYEQGMTHWEFPPIWEHFNLDASHPYLLIDHNRCILCRRCVRACGELAGIYTLGIEERGSKSQLVADLGVPLGTSTCVSCGMCAQVCPTGAIIDRESAYLGKQTQLDQTESICVGCSVGCGVVVHTRDNQLVRIESNWEAPVNQGLTCKVGRFLPLADDRERIKSPLVRKDGQLVPATWDEAMELAASHLKPLIATHEVAALISDRLPSEALSAFKQLFAQGFQSPAVSTLDEGLSTSAATRLAEKLTHPFESPLSALEQADLVLVASADLANDHEVAGFFVRRGLFNGKKLVVVSALATGLEAHATVSLSPQVGSEKKLFNRLTEFVKSALPGAGSTSPEALAHISQTAQDCGVSPESLKLAAYMMASAQNPVFLYGKDLNDDALEALVELGRAKENAAIIGLKGQANSFAAAQYGLNTPLKLNSQQAVYVCLGDENPSQKLIQRLKTTPYLIVQASHASQLTAIANIVLPVEMWAEQSGHYLNLEGRLQKAEAALIAPQAIRANIEVIGDLAEKLGIKLDPGAWKNTLHHRVSPAKITAGDPRLPVT